MTSLISYWSILKSFLNNKKIPFIPPLLHDYKFITNFKEKSELFNDFFAKKCPVVNKNSDLHLVLSKKTLLPATHFASDDILKIIKTLVPNKAHGEDMISIRMIKICDASICKALELIFRSCFENGKFPTELKKLMWFQHTKKEISKTRKTTFLLLEKYLKEYCIITCMNS